MKGFEKLLVKQLDNDKQKVDYFLDTGKSVESVTNSSDYQQTEYNIGSDKIECFLFVDFNELFLEESFTLEIYLNDILQNEFSTELSVNGIFRIKDLLENYSEEFKENVYLFILGHNKFQ